MAEQLTARWYENVAARADEREALSAIFDDDDEPSAADGPGAAPDGGGALDALVESILSADYAPPDA